MRRIVLVISLLLATPALARAQTPCVPDGKPTGVVFGRSNITFTSADHAATDPAGNLKVQDYFGEVRVKGTTDPIVGTFGIPKTSVTPVTGTGVPAGCFQAQFPTVGGLLQTVIYELKFYARNPAGTLSTNPPTTDFFLSAASVPASPGNLEVSTP